MGVSRTELCANSKEVTIRKLGQQGCDDSVMLGLHRIATNLGTIYELKNFAFLGLVSSR